MSNVDKIKERLSVADVVGAYLKLQKAGSNFKAKCPFHNEKTPSFFVSPDRGSYYCFGCGAKGDIFNFIQEIEGLDFLGALKLLADRAGVDLKFEEKRDKGERERLFDLLDIATAFFQSNLEKDKPAVEYLKKRSVRSSSISDWRIGYAKDTWRDLASFAEKMGFREGELLKVGLIKKAEGGRIYDVFRGRIIFPIFDSAGRPIAFSGRLFPEKEQGGSDGQVAPKYLNSPETELFNKSETLYGLDRAKSDIRSKNYTVLVEGQMDLILSHQAGFTNTVATSGTALTINQLQRLKRLSERVIFSYDGDQAGFKAVERAARLAISLGMNARVAALPKGEDPASLIAVAPEKYLSLLKTSKHIINFYLEKIMEAGFDKRRQDREIALKILPFLKIIPSGIEQARFISEVAEKSDIPEAAIQSDLKKIRLDEEFLENLENKEFNSSGSQSNRKSNIMSRLAGIVFWLDKSPDNSRASEIRQKILSFSDLDFRVFLEEVASKKEGLVFEAEVYFSGKDNLDEIIEDLVFNLEEEILKDQLSDALRELKDAESKREKDDLGRLLSRCQELSQKLNTLKTRVAKYSYEK